MVDKQTTKEYFRILSVLYSALIGSQILFGLVAFYYNNNGSYRPQMKGIEEIFIYIAIGLIIYGLVVGSIISKKRLQTCKNKTSIFEKLNDYRSILIIRYALLEGSSFFCLVSYLLTGNSIFLYLSILIIVLFILFKPSVDKTISDLELNPNEIQILNNPDAIIT